jgi:hypothetical protein
LKPLLLWFQKSKHPMLLLVCAAAGSPASQVTEKLYRLGSVAQDTCLCLWDLVMEEDAYCSTTGTGGTGGLK